MISLYVLCVFMFCVCLISLFGVVLVLSLPSKFLEKDSFIRLFNILSMILITSFGSLVMLSFGIAVLKLF